MSKIVIEYDRLTEDVVAYQAFLDGNLLDSGTGDDEMTIASHVYDTALERIYLEKEGR